MGCIQSGAPVNIVHFNYKSDAATARLLPSENILRLMRNTLLRSAIILDGFFYYYVIVTEADADRGFIKKLMVTYCALCPI